MRWRFQIPIIVDERSSQGRGGFAADSPRPGFFTVRSPFQAARHEIEKAVLFFHGFVSGGMGYPVRAVRRSMLLTHASFGCFLCSPLRCVPILTQARSVLPPDCSGHFIYDNREGRFSNLSPTFCNAVSRLATALAAPSMPSKLFMALALQRVQGHCQQGLLLFSVKQ